MLPQIINNVVILISVNTLQYSYERDYYINLKRQNYHINFEEITSSVGAICSYIFSSYLYMFKSHAS